MNPFAHFEDQFGHLQLSDNDAALHVFLAGWNSAMMEMMQRVNKMPFGDDTRASFAVYFQNQMVNVDAIEKPAQFDPSAGTQISKVWWDGDKLMAKPIPLESIYKEPEQPAQQEPWLLETAQTLAQNLARKFYPEVTQWECLSDLAGVISQIDNMTTGLMRKPTQRQPLTLEEIAEAMTEEVY